MKPTDEQLFCIETVKTNRITVIQACAGSGKEQPITSIVQTPDGNKMLGDIKIGDYVFGKNGKPIKVIGVFPQGIKPNYKISFHDGSSTNCGLDHLWSVKSYKKFKTLSLREILAGNFLRNSGVMKYQIPLCDPVEYSAKETTGFRIPSYVLGICISDGYLSGSNTTISVSDRDIDILNKVQELLPIETKFGYHRTGDNCVQYTISLLNEHKQHTKNCNPITAEIRRFGLDVASRYKFIPIEYLHDSVENRIELLRGLMDGDGNCSKNRTRFSTMSLNLANDIIELVQSLGGTAILQTSSDGGYDVNVKTHFNPFHTKFKKSQWSFSHKNPPSRYIRNIEYIGYCEQVCIKVDADDSLYLTDQFIVTHNTSTLVLIAKEMVQPSMYLSFNKIGADEATQKFPSHVECRTTHALAYRIYGRALNHKLSRPKGSYVNVAGTGMEVAYFYKIQPLWRAGNIVVSQAFLGTLVIKTVQNFEQSDGTTIEVEHVPTYELKQLADEHKFDAGVVASNILKNARRMWSDRIDLNSVVMATHDTYLKQWQLSKPLLDVDIIYLDESQDTTACVLDVVMQQKHAKIVLVGDKRQNIYEWRGSINAMDRVGKTVTQCTLSRSFRYGKAVADIATLILDHDMNIIGRDDIPSIVGSHVVDKTKPYTVLCRTNAYLITNALLDLEAGKIVSIEIDVRDFVKLLESTQALFEDNFKGVKHERVVPYPEWKDLLEESQHGGEFARISSIVIGGQTARIIGLLQNYTKPQNPHIIYTTGHKSKGREFEQVILGEDYPSNYDKTGSWIGLEKSEQNLLYVAATRAIMVLEYNRTVIEILERNKPIKTIDDILSEMMCEMEYEILIP